MVKSNFPFPLPPSMNLALLIVPSKRVASWVLPFLIFGKLGYMFKEIPLKSAMEWLYAFLSSEWLVATSAKCTILLCYFQSIKSLPK
jgi:hypothetical protein